MNYPIDRAARAIIASGLSLNTSDAIDLFDVVREDVEEWTETQPDRGGLGFFMWRGIPQFCEDQFSHDLDRTADLALHTLWS